MMSLTKKLLAAVLTFSMLCGAALPGIAFAENEEDMLNTDEVIEETVENTDEAVVEEIEDTDEAVVEEAEDTDEADDFSIGLESVGEMALQAVVEEGNLCSSATVISSNPEYANGVNAKVMFDGNPDTQFVSYSGFSGGEYLLDLGAAKKFNKVTVIRASNNASANYKLTVSCSDTQSGTYKTVLDKWAVPAGNNSQGDVYFDAEAEGRYVKFTFSDGDGTGNEARITFKEIQLCYEKVYEAGVTALDNAKISGTAKVGSRLNGSYKLILDGADVSGTKGETYKWYRSDSAAGVYTEISGAKSKSYVLTSADKGKYIAFEINCAEAKPASIRFEGYGPVQEKTVVDVPTEPTKPTVEHLYITSDSGAVVGAELTINADYLGGATKSTSTYEWYRADFADIAATDQKFGNTKLIDGATGEKYTLTDSDAGKYIYCKIKPEGGVQEVSFGYGKVVKKGSGAPSVDPSSMKLWAKDTRIGTTIYAHYTFQNPDGAKETGTEIVWQRSDKFNGTYTDIPNAKGSTYVFKPEDYGKFIRYRVTPKGGATAEFDTTIEAWPGASLNNTKAVYCTPESLMLFPLVTSTDTRNPFIKARIQGTSDFILDNYSNMTWGGLTPHTYVFDAGKSIQWDKIIMVSNRITQVDKLEVSDNGTDYEDLNISPRSITSYQVQEILLNEPTNGRYIRATVSKDSNSYLMEFQAMLQPASFSEVLGSTISAVKVDRLKQTILNVPYGTTAAQLKESLIASTEAPVLSVLDYDGNEIGDNDVIVSGYSLYSVSANSKNVSEYRISNDETMPSTIVKEISVSTGKDSKLGVRVGFTVTGEYKVESYDGPFTGSVSHQWYYSPEAGGEYVKIDGATGKSYTVTDKEEGGYIRLEVTPQDGVATMSPTYGPVREKVSDKPTAPTCSHISVISANEEVYEGDVLTGEYSYFDANADDEDTAKTEKQWFRVGKSGKRVPIAGAVGDSYTVTADDVESGIVFGVKPYAVAEPQPEDFSYSKTVDVLQEPAVADYEALSIGNNLKNVVSNLILPLSGKRGSVITWQSDNPQVIGTDGVVKQQKTEQKVTLTATIKHPDREPVMTKVFEDIVVPAKKASGPAGGGSGGGSGSAIYAPTITRPEITAPVVPDENQDGAKDDKFGLTDIKPEDWAYPYVIDLMEKGVLSKPTDGRFNPTSSLKREESVKMLAELFGVVDEAASCDFTDVADGEWSYKYIASAASKGLVKGIGDGLFGTGANVTRQDFAVMTYNFMKAMGKTGEIDAVQLTFTDGDSISDYAQEAVEYLVNSGAINGTPDGEFLPTASITREEAAKILSCLLAD